jgi:hypothetical protein
MTNARGFSQASKGESVSHRGLYGPRRSLDARGSGSQDIVTNAAFQGVEDVIRNSSWMSGDLENEASLRGCGEP